MQRSKLRDSKALSYYDCQGDLRDNEDFVLRMMKLDHGKGPTSHQFFEDE